MEQAENDAAADNYAEAPPPLKQERRSSVRKRKRQSQPCRSKKRKIKASTVGLTELERYMKECQIFADTAAECYEAYDDDSMLYWAARKTQYAHLFDTAKATFVILASSTSIERVFSRNKRNRIGSRGNKKFKRNEDELILGSYLRMLR